MITKVRYAWYSYIDDKFHILQIYLEQSASNYESKGTLINKFMTLMTFTMPLLW